MKLDFSSLQASRTACMSRWPEHSGERAELGNAFDDGVTEGQALAMQRVKAVLDEAMEEEQALEEGDTPRYAEIVLARLYGRLGIEHD